MAACMERAALAGILQQLLKLVWWYMAVVGVTCLFGCVTRLPVEGVPRLGTYKKKVDLKVGFLRRSYLVHVPTEYDHSKAYPLVVVIHGAFSTAGEIETHSGFSALADREGFIVLYPNCIGLFGFLQHWNSGHCCGKAMHDNVDDVGFLTTVIEDVCGRFNVDRDRVYMVGNSNGGMLTYRFAAERSGMVAAIAPVAATIGGKPQEDKPEWRIQQPTMPMPVIAFHGRTDKQLVYEGGRSKRKRGTITWISVAESIAFWVKNNGIDRQLVPERLRQGRVLREAWSGGENAPDVVLYTIEQWGHVWPGHYFTDRLAASDALKGFDAAAIMWEFFKRYRRQN